MKKRTISILLSVLLVSCLSQTVTAFAEESAAVTESEAVAAEPQQMKVLGEESEDAYRIELTNNSGKDLEYFSVDLYDPDSMEYDIDLQIKNALMKEGYLQADADPETTKEAIAAYREAYGLSSDAEIDAELLELLLGEGYDGNLLSHGDLFASGETRILYVPRTNEEAEEEQMPENDPLTEAFKELSMKPEYVVTFLGKGESLTHSLFAFPVSIMETAELNIENKIPYVLYTVSGSSEQNSTLDAEKAASAVIFPDFKIAE